MTKVEVTNNEKESMFEKARMLRRMAIRLSFVLFVLVPTLLAGIYNLLIASEQFEVESRFSVRGVETNVGGGVLSLFTGVPESGSTTSDSYILMDYMFSGSLIRSIDLAENLDSTFGPRKADFLSRLSSGSSIEAKTDFWRRMVSIDYDSRSQVIAMSVRAFTPEDALRISTKLIEMCQALVNELSLSARSDALSFAKSNADELEQKLIKAQEEILAFRNMNKVIDPTTTAVSRTTIVENMLSQISLARADLKSLQRYLSNDSPRIVVLKGKIESLEKQAKAEQIDLGEDDIGVPQLINSYEKLLLQKEFSEKRYISALASLETARLKAAQKQKYLAVFAQPLLPEEASYPNRIVNTIFVFVICGIMWVISVLVVYAVRDHST